MIVRVSKTSPRVREREADCVEQPEEPLGEQRARGRARSSEATIPTTSASTMIEPSTCRLEAPSVRSVASSRVRCAIVIESEFAMTNAPTKSAMPPNASRKPWRNVMNSFVSSASAARLFRRRSGPACRRKDLLDLRDELLRRTPGFAAIAISSSWPSLSSGAARSGGRSRRASRRRWRARAELMIPEIFSFWTGPSAWTPIGLADLVVLLGGRRPCRP